jgi:hypothetical protein
VSQPLALDAWVTDDGLPPPPGQEGGPAPRLRGAPAGVQRLQGLALRWRVYRGTGAVSISDPTPKAEQGKARTTVTFSQPGDYTLHLQALDSRSGTKCCWTNGYVKVAVSPARAADKKQGWPERPGQQLATTGDRREQNNE